MGYVLVRKADLAPEIAGGAERSGSQLFTGQGGLQSFIDPSRRDLSEIEGSTLGFYPSHFTHPDTGKVHEHPLAGQPIINPRAGQSKYGSLKPAMYGTRGLGALLGLYSAAMAFGGDDDQDALSSALNALGQGYTTYASTAPMEQIMGRIADRGQAQRASDISNRHGASAVGVNQAARGQLGAGRASPIRPVNIFSPGGKGNQPKGKINVYGVRRPPPPSYTTSGHVMPSASAVDPSLLTAGNFTDSSTGSIDSDISLGPAMEETGWTEGNTTFDVEGGSTADDSPPPPEEEKERKERQTRIDEDWEDGGAWGGRS
mgnify:FL=1